VIPGARSWAWAIAVGLSGAVLLVLLSRSVIGHPVHYDELLHMLAARGLLQTGVPVIADGLYERAELYTRAVAWSFREFGESPVSARLPALGAGAVLVFVVGAWVVRHAGLLAGLTAAILLCLVPTTVGVAVFARFYTMHAVVMTLVFISAYEALQPGRHVGVRAVLALAVVALIALGWHFQETTIIAAGAVVVAVVAVLVMDHWAQVRGLIARRPMLTLGSLAFGVLIAIFAVWYLGLLQQLGSTALWAAGNATRYQYYLVEFRNDLPLLWPLLPVAAAIAVLNPAHRRLALFCAVAIAAALVVHSVAAQKTMRYAYYLVPLMCVLWAIALSTIAMEVPDRGAAVGRGTTARATWFVLALVAVSFVLSQEGARALNVLLGRTSNLANRPFADEPDWTPIVAELAPRAHEADRVVTSNSMKALYYLGRYDYELNATIVPETESRSDFGLDARTGRQAIGAPESVRQVLDQPGTTMVVIETSKIGRASGVTTEALAVIESSCRELRLPANAAVRGWWCDAGPRAAGP